MKGIVRRVWLPLCALLVCCSGPERSGSLPAPAVGSTANRLRSVVQHLTTLGADPLYRGERHVWQYGQLCAASDFIERQFRAMGYAVRKQEFDLHGPVKVWNLIAELPGSGPGIFTIGAHYDTRVAMSTPRVHGPPLPELQGTPGANDNGSGVAVMLELARRLRGTHPRQTIRFVAFTNEEPPWFRTEFMGSLVYARWCKANGERLTGAMVFDTVGYYTQDEDSQTYPFPNVAGLPKTGNYVAFISTWGPQELIRKADAAFGEKDKLPSLAVAIPAVVPLIAWSDDWAFTQEGITAFCVTDTAHARYHCYHRVCDTAEKLDYNKMAIVAEGLVPVVNALVAAP